MVSKRYYNIYNLVLLLNDVLLQLTLVAAKVTTRSTTTTAGGYASSSSVDDTKPTVSTKYHGLDSVKTTASKRIKTNNQLQLSATQLENNDSSYLLANSSPVVLVNSRANRTSASLKRSRDSPTTNESQEQFFEGIAFPRRTTQEESTSSLTADETTKLRAEIEELKKSVQALCASNKTLLESQAVKTQMIIDSDSGRSHRSTAARPREIPREIPKKQATVSSGTEEQNTQIC